MADLNTSGREAVEKNSRLKLRKMEVHLLRLKAQVIEAETEIEAKEAFLEETRKQLAEKQKEYDITAKEVGANG